jgi:[ribosomal protein S5]-alanine N-acetyltransferase
MPSYRGKGYATEMGKAMVKWAFTRPNVKKITATCNQDNYASIRVLEKIGFHIVNKSKEKYFWEYL